MKVSISLGAAALAGFVGIVAYVGYSRDPGTGIESAPHDGSVNIEMHRILAPGEWAPEYVFLSPDGQKVHHVARARGEVFLDRFPASPVARHWSVQPEARGIAGSVAVSPDGNRVAVAWRAPGPKWDTTLRLYRHGKQGFDLLYRQRDTEWLRPVGWTIDGASIIVLRERLDGLVEVLRVSTESSPTETVHSLGWTMPMRHSRVALSGDGRFLAFDRPVDPSALMNDVYVLDLDGGEPVAVASDPETNDRLLGWTPHGDLFFHSDRGGTQAGWLQPMDGGRPDGLARLVWPDAWAVEPVGFTDRGTFAYTVFTEYPRAFVLPLTVPPKGEDADDTLLPEARSLGLDRYREIRHPLWAPDGRSILYQRVTPGHAGTGPFALSVRSVETGQDWTLYPWWAATHGVEELRWLDEGIRLLAVCCGTAGRSALHLINIQTEFADEIAVLRSGRGRVRSASPSPDPERIVYSLTLEDPETGERRSRILRRSHVTSVEEVLIEANGDVSSLAVDPARNRLAFIVDLGAETRLGVYDFDRACPRDAVEVGGGCRADALVAGDPLPAGAGSLAWSSDARHVLFSAGPPGGKRTVWMMSASGQDQTVISEPMYGVGELSGLSVHPDGSRVIFSAGRTRSELWEIAGVPLDLER